MSKKIAVVTGANRGLGFETARQLSKKGFHVLLTARSEEKAQSAVQKLAEEGLETEGAVLDVSSDESVSLFFETLQATHGRVDILVNNAGAIFENDTSGEFDMNNTFSIPAAILLKAFNNNSLSAYRMIQHALPLMNEAGYGRIVNVSSGMGQLGEMGSGYPAYRVSKTAMNAITKVFSNHTNLELK